MDSFKRCLEHQPNWKHAEKEIHSGTPMESLLSIHIRVGLRQFGVKKKTGR